MENRGHTMADGKFDFGFAVEWMRKDLAIALAEANRNGARLPSTALIDQFYAQVVARGYDLCPAPDTGPQGVMLVGLRAVVDHDDVEVQISGLLEGRGGTRAV